MISLSKASWQSLFFPFFLLNFLTFITLSSQTIKLTQNSCVLVFADESSEPLKIAVNALKNDFRKVMGFVPDVQKTLSKNSSTLQIVIINRKSDSVKAPSIHVKKVDGCESHHVYVDASSRRIYLEGYDTRGTIYAIYTFCEKILGVPPLHHWSSFSPTIRSTIEVSSEADWFFSSPEVKYRAILPNDKDLFQPWHNKSHRNEDIWLETVLRLKLNTIETDHTFKEDESIFNSILRMSKHGLIVTSHHFCALNATFASWDSYWTEIRPTKIPELLLANEKEILEFYTHNAMLMYKSGIENLWTISFRGIRDEPFWNIFKDAPKDDKGRADVINKMLKIQVNIIKEVTGESNPFIRVTFYNEVADLLDKGYLKPPINEAIIWTYVAARRDHYPPPELYKLNSHIPVKLGYYMNFGFCSTGAHFAPAEGPWKIEFNFRTARKKGSLYFAVANVGNVREFLFELSAYAKMLWSFDAYSTETFLKDYVIDYFGHEKEREIVKLFKDYYDAFWQQKKSKISHLDRQFVFQDLRYVRAIEQLIALLKKDLPVNVNPLIDVGREVIQGRSFNIDIRDNNARDQLEAIIKGMKNSNAKFTVVEERCQQIIRHIDKKRRIFLYDSLCMYAGYLAHLGNVLLHITDAYKNKKSKHDVIQHLSMAYQEAGVCQTFLNEADHGIFNSWYKDGRDYGRTFQIKAFRNNLLDLINNLRFK